LVEPGSRNPLLVARETACLPSIATAKLDQLRECLDTLQRRGGGGAGAAREGRTAGVCPDTCRHALTASKSYHGNAQGSEEVALELREGKGAPPPPTDVTTGWSVDFVWKGTTFERMQRAMRVLAVEETSVSGYLYHR